MVGGCRGRSQFDRAEIVFLFCNNQLGGKRMSGRKLFGIIGMVVGAAWFSVNVRHFNEDGFVAIAMPLIIFILGLVYFLRARKQSA